MSDKQSNLTDKEMEDLQSIVTDTLANLCCEMPYDNKPKYCKHCGQRLDFKEV